MHSSKYYMNRSTQSEMPNFTIYKWLDFVDLWGDNIFILHDDVSYHSERAQSDWFMIEPVFESWTIGLPHGSENIRQNLVLGKFWSWKLLQLVEFQFPLIFFELILLKIKVIEQLFSFSEWAHLFFHHQTYTQNPTKWKLTCLK